MPRKRKNPAESDAPWFPAKNTRCLKARWVDLDGRYCVLCRRVAKVFVDVKRGHSWWVEAFPLCEGCAKELPIALGEVEIPKD